ncbi:MAG TPA: hypothetical protein VLF64_02615 [Candidatus Saccharimonadales bacterium]|nr:hypothetical protein [Candidatus Saccharimonadales bacterium]
MRLAHIRQKGTFNEPVWHVLVVLTVAIVLQAALNNQLTFGFKYVIIALEVVLFVILSTFFLPLAWRRIVAIALLALISVANMVSLSVVIAALIGSAQVNGHELLFSSVVIYLTNVIVFGLWYWELDNQRTNVDDFQFPQRAGETSQRPTFLDYLYVSITNASAFSPTDTLPLTHRAKYLMALQSLTSLAIVVLVTARAVNILS